MAFGLFAAAVLMRFWLPHSAGSAAGMAVLLVGVIAVAAWCGLAYGLLTACFAAIVEAVLPALPAFRINMALIAGNVAIFSAVALLVGLYTDYIRQKVKAVGEPDLRSWRLLWDKRPEGAVRFDWRCEAEDAGVALLMVACAAVAAFGFDRAGAGIAGQMFFPAAIVMVAVLRGTRPAMVAAIATVAFLPEVAHADSGSALVALVLFSAMAWGIGGYSDHVRYEHKVSRTLIEAGQILSVATDEGVIRRILQRAICDICGTAAVWVIDENGRSFDGRSRRPPGLDAVLSVKMMNARTLAAAPWHVRPIQTEGCIMGHAVWPASAVVPKEIPVVERGVAGLVDMAAVAISRTRTAAEHMDMQLVAQAEKLRTALLSSISHDFRTPLSGILGAATGLLELGDQYDKARQRNLLCNIRNQALRLNRYVENLLSMTQFESGVLKVNMQSLVVEPMIYDAWEALGDFGGSLRMIDVRIEQDASIRTDSVLFFQVLMNLFENTIKYTPEGAAVIVRGRKSGASQLIEIVDSGPGVAPDDLGKIFTRFYRGDRKAGSGLGLGLYITKCLLDSMGAMVEVRNRADGQTGLIMAMTMPAGDLPA